MKKIDLWLVRKHKWDDDSGRYNLVITDADEDIDEALAEEYDIAPEDDCFGDNDLHSAVMQSFDVKPVDPDRLAQLLGR